MLIHRSHHVRRRHLAPVTLVLALLPLAACGAAAHVGHSGTPSTHRPTGHGGDGSPPGRGSTHPVGVVRLLNPGGFLDDVAVTGHTLWVTDMDGNRVVRVDTATGRLLPAAPVADGPLGIVAAGDAVWVASYQGTTITRLNQSGHHTTVVHTPSASPTGLAAQGRQVWVVDQSDGKGLVVDNTTGKVLRHLATGLHAGFAATAFGAVWIGDFAGDTGRIARLSTASGKPALHTVTGQAPLAFAAAHGGLWVSNAKSNTVTEIDPHSGKVERRVSLPGAGPGGITFAAGSLWVGGYNNQTLYRIDPRTGTVQARLHLVGPPQQLTWAAGHLWVALSSGQIAEVVTHPTH